MINSTSLNEVHFNSKRLQTSTKSLSLSDSNFEQVGHGFNSEI
jgi:hypothetical protein